MYLLLSPVYDWTLAENAKFFCLTEEGVSLEISMRWQNLIWQEEKKEADTVLIIHVLVGGIVTAILSIAKWNFILFIFQFGQLQTQCVILKKLSVGSLF